MDSSQNSYIGLQKRSQENCDFCDRTFKNRFDSIIHNASHIIIPLIKQDCHQCDICLHYFASPEELDEHHETKHATSTTNSRNNTMFNTKIKFENSNELTDDDRNDYSLRLEFRRHSSNYKDSITNLKEEISSNLKNCNSVEKSIIKPEKHRNDVDIKEELLNVEDLENDDGILIKENDCNGKSDSIKSRLRFEGEDDLFDGVILSDLVTGCTVNIFNEPINQMPGFKNLNSRSINSNNKILNGSNYQTQTTISNNHTQLKLNNNYNMQAIWNRNVNPTSNENCSELRNLLICDNHLNNQKKPEQNLKVTQPNVLEKFTVESNNPLTLIDDLEYDNFVVRNIQKVEQHDETDLLVNHIKKIDKSNIAELLEPEYNSVHYSELIKPGIFKCKYCSKSFPNRLLLVQHEPAHMRARQPRPLLCTYCDVYVAGHHRGLRRHLDREHPGASPGKKHVTHRCQKCGLRFRKYLRHVQLYHTYECHGCGKEYSENESTQLQEHILSCATQNKSSKILNVCEMCYSFIKVKMNLKYILMGTTKYLPGVRYPCSMCGKKHFELRTIKRILYGTSAMPRCYKKKPENRKPMSNEQRLKKFQHRLKQINLLNKF